MAQHGRYTVLRKLANGGMAEIFLATQQGHEGFQKPVVLKRILGSISADPQFQNMLIDEARISMMLTHSNIVQVLDLGRAGGRYFLALELVDGWDLGHVLHRSKLAGWPLPPPLGLFVVAEVCRALAYAHAKRGPDGLPLGIVHRDVSPNNVLISEHGEVKLTDFGIAKAMRKREHTGTGVVKGKVAFMSPEQGLGKPIDARSDLFSLGTLLYLVMTGVRPFEAPTDLETLLRVQQAEFRSPAEVRPDLAPDVVHIILRAMQQNLQLRYQSADEMLVDLERALRADFGGVGQTELKQYLAELERRDGIPTIARAQPVVESQDQSSGPALLEGNAVVLADASDLGAEDKTALSELAGGNGGEPLRLTRRAAGGADFSGSGPTGTLGDGRDGRNGDVGDDAYDELGDLGEPPPIRRPAPAPGRGRVAAGGRGPGEPAGVASPAPRARRRQVEELSFPDDAADDSPPSRYRGRRKSRALPVFLLVLVGAVGGFSAVRHFGWPVALAALIDHALTVAATATGTNLGSATEPRAGAASGAPLGAPEGGGPRPAVPAAPGPVGAGAALRKAHPAPTNGGAIIGRPASGNPAIAGPASGAQSATAPAARVPDAPGAATEGHLARPEGTAASPSGTAAAAQAVVVSRPATPPPAGVGPSRAQGGAQAGAGSAVTPPAAQGVTQAGGASTKRPAGPERVKARVGAGAASPGNRENEVFRESARRVRSLQGLEQYPPGTIQLSPPADSPPAPPVPPPGSAPPSGNDPPAATEATP
jgi:serine/threonine-protein kinase